ncbi:UNVERIFIED_ORG: hypothetical protein E4P37_11540 [Bacillus sp. AZ43]
METSEVPAGQVTAVDPAGVLAPGDLVRLSYAVPPVSVPAPVEAPPAGDGGANGTTGNGTTGNEGGDDGDEGDEDEGDGDKGKGKGKDKPGRGNGRD